MEYLSDKMVKQLSYNVLNDLLKKNRQGQKNSFKIDMIKLILFFDRDDIIRQYIDLQKYPFNCDFYIKSKDLFIEYQGHQTHGTKPYDELDPDC